MTTPGISLISHEANLDQRGPSVPILLVDDDLVSTEARKMILEFRFGCQVMIAASAWEALTTLTKMPVELVITDFHMPHVNGIALARMIRAIWPKIPILMLTGDSSVPADFSAAVDDLVLKGDVPELFLERVVRLLSKAKSPAAK